MRPVLKVSLLTATVACFVCLLIGVGQSTQQTPSKGTPAIKRENLLPLGKKLFVERCSSCHGERGDKALKSGEPLSRRKLGRKEIERAVRGRFKDKPEEERQAVILYIESLIKN